MPQYVTEEQLAAAFATRDAQRARERDALRAEIAELRDQQAQFLRLPSLVARLESRLESDAARHASAVDLLRTEMLEQTALSHAYLDRLVSMIAGLEPLKALVGDSEEPMQ